jgi:hypothetical protein
VTLGAYRAPICLSAHSSLAYCGALYAVTYARLSSSDSNVARCVVCGQIMDKWDSTKVPIFKLIHRPEDY